MSYHEISMKGYPAASLHIEPGHGATVFDVDYVGQNDGQDPDPDASFRLIFQLGSGLMIYLYVVGMTRPGNRRGFHTFWIKYCAAMDVEMEELGPPSHVEGGPFELPVVFKGFTLSHGGAGEFRGGGRNAHAEELASKFGERPWLAVPEPDTRWPPDRDDLATTP